MTFRELISPYLPPNFLRARIAKGTLWSIIAAMTLQSSNILGSIFCARILGVEEFGEFNLFRSTIQMFAVIAGSGFGVVATKYIAEYRDSKPEYAGKMLGVLLRITYYTGFVASSICFLLASSISSLAMNAPELAVLIRIGSILLFFYAISGIQIGVICGFESFQTVLIINSWEALFNLVSIPVGAYMYGLSGAVGGSVIAAIAVFPIKKNAMIKECKLKNIIITYESNKENAAEILKTLIPSVLLGIVFYPFEWLSKFILARQHDGLIQLGIFAAANSFGAFVNYIPGQLLSTAQPLFSNLLGKGEMQTFKRLAKFNILLSGGSSIVIALSLGAISKFLMGTYGVSYVSETRVLMILAAANIFYAFVIPYYKIMVSYNKIWIQAFFTAFLGISLVVSNYFLISLGAAGLAISYLIAWFLMFSLESIWIWGLLKTE